MRILNIVSSNIVQDPRVVKQMETIKSLTDDYIVIGKNNKEVNDKRLETLNFRYILIGDKKVEDTLIKKIWGRLKFAIKTIKYIKEFNPTIIHANDFDTLFIVFLSRNKKAKIVYDAHEIYSKNAFINKYYSISFIVQTLEKFILKDVSAFITVSNAAKGYYEKKSYPLSPTVITNAPIKKDITSAKKNQSKFEIVYQGQLVENRGYEEFLLSAEYITDPQIELIIRGMGNLKDKIVNLKNENDFLNVKIDPPIEMNQLVDKLAESHIGVVLTKGTSINFEYTVSNKIFECLHAGLPLILSPVKEHIYLNKIYNFAIIIDEVTPMHIAKAIEELYNNPKLYKELKENAVKASEILTWQNESKKLKDIYLSCIENDTAEMIK